MHPSTEPAVNASTLRSGWTAPNATATLSAVQNSVKPAGYGVSVDPKPYAQTQVDCQTSTAIQVLASLRHGHAQNSIDLPSKCTPNGQNGYDPRITTAAANRLTFPPPTPIYSDHPPKSATQSVSSSLHTFPPPCIPSTPMATIPLPFPPPISPSQPTVSSPIPKVTEYAVHGMSPSEHKQALGAAFTDLACVIPSCCTADSTRGANLTRMTIVREATKLITSTARYLKWCQAEMHRLTRANQSLNATISEYEAALGAAQLENDRLFAELKAGLFANNRHDYNSFPSMSRSDSATCFQFDRTSAMGIIDSSCHDDLSCDPSPLLRPAKRRRRPRIPAGVQASKSQAVGENEDDDDEDDAIDIINSNSTPTSPIMNTASHSQDPIKLHVSCCESLFTQPSKLSRPHIPSLPNPKTRSHGLLLNYRSESVVSPESVPLNRKATRASHLATLQLTHTLPTSPPPDGPPGTRTGTGTTRTSVRLQRKRARSTRTDSDEGEPNDHEGELAVLVSLPSTSPRRNVLDDDGPVSVARKRANAVRLAPTSGRQSLVEDANSTVDAATGVIRKLPAR